jgi:RHS repeat-associated protein
MSSAVSRVGNRFRTSRAFRGSLGVVLVGAMAASLMGATVRQPVDLPSQRPAVPGTPLVPHTVVPVGKGSPASPKAEASAAPADSAWPPATSASVDLTAPNAAAKAPATGWAAVAHQVAGTPVAVRALGALAPQSALASDTAPPDTATGSAPAGPSATAVTAAVLAHTAATAVGVDGVVFSVTPGARVTSALSVALNYSSFTNAAGGDYGSRLHLVALPACALTTPKVAACRVQQPIASAQNDYNAQVLSATVTPAATGDRAMVLAATSGPTGPTGDFNATSLAPEGSWTSGGNTGSFTWSYPIAIPPVAAGQVAPSVSLSYDSGAVDGETGTTNNQSSWVGQGWDYEPGFIERTYQSCSAEKSLPKADQTDDNCWDGQILTISLNGQTQSIVQDSSGNFHLQDDDGSRLQHLTSTTNGNGAQNGEYWELTTTDGTEYFFGLNKAPGYTNQATTNSTYTEPVYGPNSTDPCYSNAGFTKSVCTQAYRWNVDYVQDANGNAAMYYYTPQTNYYVPDNAQNGTTPVSYISGGQLATIDYGMRYENGTVYGAKAPEQITFTTAGRCSALPSSTGTCPALTTANSTSWPDTPADLACTAGSTTCANYSPAMFTTKRLTTITTQIWNATTSAYQPVDSYALSQQFPSTGDEELVLSGITHTGYDSTGANPLPEPEITFEGQLYDNRVPGYGSLPGLSHWRMYNIVTETGETISITYNTPQCTSANLPPTTDTVAQQQAFASTNTMNCYPVYWTPPGYSAPTFDYFDKYTVASVKVSDPNALSPAQITNYYYLGGAAWHYDDNQLVPATQRTYGQYRGYGQVETTTGDTQNSSNGVPDGLTLTKDTYFRGMDQNTLPNNGVQSASATDSLNGSYTDSEAFAGQTLETQIFNGATLSATTGLPVPGPEVSAVITTPEILATTATETVTGLPALTAQIVGTSSKRTYTDLAAGGTTLHEVANSYDSFGRVIASTDSGTNVSTTCTTTSYAGSTANTTGTWVQDDVSEVIVAAQACPSPAGTPLTATAIMRDTRSYYDSSTTLGAQPVQGNLTRTDEAVQNTAGTLTWITDDTQATYDTSGRTLTSTDALGHVTTKAYTPTDGGPLTELVESNPICAATPTAVGCGTETTMYDPGRGVVTETIDAAKHKTTAQYDSLGRLTAEWTPGFVQGIADASTTYSYLERNNGPEAVTTNTLVDDGASSNNLNYTTSIALYDAMGQKIQTQATGENGALLGSDTMYDSHGWAIAANNQYATNGTPSTTLISVAASSVNSRTQTTFDGVGRPVLVAQYNGLTETSAAQSVYGGDRISTIGRMADGVTFDPGVTASTTITNVRGQTTEVDQYTGAPTVSGSVVTGPSTGTIAGTAGTLATTYSYDALGQQTGMSDSAGDTWSTTFDLLGRKTSTTDPDMGTSRTVYDSDGDTLSTSDADGHVLSYQYDLLNRKIAEYDSATQNSSTQIAGWLWDTEQKGQLTSTSTMNVALANGTTGTVVNQADGYNVQGLAGGSVVTIPAGETGLAGTYTTQLTYSSTGLLTSETPAAMPGSPTETVTNTYDAAGNPLTASGYNAYTSAATYTPYGELAQQTLGASNAPVWQTYTYDQQTRGITNVNVSAQLAAPQLDNTAYTLNTANQITSITDTQGNGTTAPVEQQCYDFDALGRLTEAYTAAAPSTNGSCASDPATDGSAVVGGPQPYWESWAFDQIGQRTSQTQYAVAGQSGGNVTTSYTYGETGHANALSGISTSTSSGTTTLTGFTYDPNGNSLTYPDAGTSGTQTLGWDAQGQLISDNTASGDNTTQVNDANGAQLITRDSATDTDTLYLTGEQLAYNTSTKASTGTRYYTFNGATIAERIAGGNPQYLVSDMHGTNLISIDSVSMAVTRREMDPYGNQVGATTGGTWQGQLGFLNKPQDAATGLIDDGARYYDPVTGRFLSVDPVLETSDPQELNGYAYAACDPINGSDPTGDNWLMNTWDDFTSSAVKTVSNSYHSVTKYYNSVKKDVSNCDGGNMLRCGKGIFDSTGVGMAWNELDGLWNATGNFAGSCATGMYSTCGGNTLGLGLACADMACLGQPGGGFKGTKTIPGLSKDKWTSGSDSNPDFDTSKIEKALGGNLSSNFSVFDAWDPNTGVATSIKTIDWRYASYTKPAQIISKGKGFVNSLTGFENGTNSAHSQDRSMVLSPNDVDDEVLDLAFPAQGVTNTQLQAYQQIATYGYYQGITVNLIPVETN